MPRRDMRRGIPGPIQQPQKDANTKRGRKVIPCDQEDHTMTTPPEQTIRPDTARRRSRSMPRRLIQAIGALLVIVAIGLLGNIAWQLWGTGIATSHAQHRLGQQFNAAIHHQPVTPSTAPSQPASSADVLPTPASSQSALPLGTVFGHIVIPKIGVNYYVVEGVGSSQLAEGPGHYPGTAAIGAAGNVGIAGHRTTHGAPFYSLNELKAGDPIYLTNTAGQTFTYWVATQFVVAPSDGAVLNPTLKPTLTLTTCDPRYSAAHRLIVQATLVP
jgi:sortase A